MARRKGGAGSLALMHCRTCRARKIRCSNERPSCQQCLRSGRECKGYDSWEVAVRTSEQKQAPTTTSNEMHLIHPDEPRPIEVAVTINSKPRQRLLDIYIGDNVRQAFEYFRHRSCFGYASRGYPTTWATHALATSNTSPAVLFAVAALGALENSMLDMVHTSLARPADSGQMNLALRLYSRAIASLCQAEPQTPSLESVIVACVAFLVFEVSRTNPLGAVRHARNGNRILNERSGLTQHVQGLANNFRSLSLQPERVVAEWNGCVAFTSLEEALSHLEVLTNAGQELQAEILRMAENLLAAGKDAELIPQNSATRFCLVHSLSRTISLPPSRQAQFNAIHNGHARWKKAFSQLMAGSEQPSRNAVRLLVRSFVARSSMLVCRSSNERWADACFDEFSATFKACELLVRWQHSDLMVGKNLMNRLATVERSSQGPVDGSLSGWESQIPAFGPPPPQAGYSPHAAGIFGQGVFAALFTIACKCRDPDLRRQAAGLLTSSNRLEGHHCGKKLGRYATAIIALEQQLGVCYVEQSSPSSSPESAHIPLSARLSDVVVSSPGNDNAVYLSCTRHPEGMMERIILEEYRCTDLDISTGVAMFDLTNTLYYPNSPL